MLEKTRGDAVEALSNAGWSPVEIAYVLRWKLPAVKAYLKRQAQPPRQPLLPPDLDALGLYPDGRAEKAILGLGIKSVPELERRLGEFAQFKGIGPVTMDEVTCGLRHTRLRAAGTPCPNCGDHSYGNSVDYTSEYCRIFCEKCSHLLGSGDTYMDALLDLAEKQSASPK